MTLPKTSDAYLSLAILLGFCFLLALVRAHTYYEPLERDITTYAVIGHEMLNGRLLYTDIWDIKPPAIYVTYMLAELVAGYGLMSIYLLNLLAATLTLLGIYVSTAILSSNPATGLWAAAIWTIISNDMSLQANQPNVEVFMNACLVWSLAILLQIQKSNDYGKILLVGLLWSLATLYKQVTIVAIILLSSAYILTASVTVTRRERCKHILWLAVIGISAWGLVCAYFVIQNRWQDFYDTLIVFGQFYSQLGQVTGESSGALMNIWLGLNPALIVPDYFKWLYPLGLATLVGIIFNQGHDKRTSYLFAYLLAVPLMIALPGKYFPHYYQLWLPGLAIGSGLAVGYSLQLRRSIGVCFSGVLLSILLFLQLPSYLLSSREWSSQKYGDLFIFTELVGNKIGELLLPEETLYQWGMETGLYFYSQRRPATGIFFYNAVVSGPLYQSFTERSLNQLKQAPPELVVMRKDALFEHPIVMWIGENYWPAPENQRGGFFQLYIRQGGHLESRLPVKPLQ